MALHLKEDGRIIVSERRHGYVSAGRHLYDDRHYSDYAGEPPVYHSAPPDTGAEVDAGVQRLLTGVITARGKSMKEKNDREFCS